MLSPVLKFIAPDTGLGQMVAINVLYQGCILWLGGCEVRGGVESVAVIAVAWAGFGCYCGC